MNGRGPFAKDDYNPENVKSYPWHFSYNDITPFDFIVGLVSCITMLRLYPVGVVMLSLKKNVGITLLFFKQLLFTTTIKVVTIK